jgi:acyl carrier protein
MSNAALQRPISRTEICQRVRGIIADALTVGPASVREALYLRVGMGITSPQLGVIVLLIESAFGIQLPEACTDEFWAAGTVGELISLVEGAVSGGIRS